MVSACFIYIPEQSVYEHSAHGTLSSYTSWKLILIHLIMQ